MRDEALISDRNIEELDKELTKTFSIGQEEAIGIVYEVSDIVEKLFNAYGEVKAVHPHLTHEINNTYRIA